MIVMMGITDYEGPQLVGVYSDLDRAATVLVDRYPDTKEIEWEQKGGEWHWEHYISIPSPWVKGQMTKHSTAAFLCYEVTLDGDLLDLTEDRAA